MLFSVATTALLALLALVASDCALPSNEELIAQCKTRRVEPERIVSLYVNDQAQTVDPEYGRFLGKTRPDRVGGKVLADTYLWPAMNDLEPFEESLPSAFHGWAPNDSNVRLERGRSIEQSSPAAEEDCSFRLS